MSPKDILTASLTAASCAAAAVAWAAEHAVSGGVLVERTNPRKFHTTVTWSVRNAGYQLTELVVVLPFPDEDQYQTVSGVKIAGGGTLQPASGGGSRYVRYALTGEALPRPGQTKELGYTCDVELYEIAARFSPEALAASARPTGGGKLTSANLPFIDPAAPAIRTASDRLWRESGGATVSFARKAYEYVAANFTYRDANTGLHPLAEVLANKGGDCGNLSSVFISLLRSRGIPARHLVAVRPDGSFHVWSEFRAGGSAWVPVDVTYKQADPAGDYFGKVRLATNAIILHKDVNLRVEKTGGSDAFVTPILQNYLWWFWGSGDPGSLTPGYKVAARPAPG